MGRKEGGGGYKCQGVEVSEVVPLQKRGARGCRKSFGGGDRTSVWVVL